MVGNILIGLVLSSAIGGLAYWRGSLTVSGWAGAVLTGTLTFGFGGWPWGLLLITFFVSSTLLSRYKARVKEQRAGEKFDKGGKRDFAQAVANGGIGALLATIYGLMGEPAFVLAAFIGTMATVTADTWATELGTLSTKPPRMITSGRVVEPGTSGGVTVLGTSATAVGALLIGLAMFCFLLLEQVFSGQALNPPWWVILAGLCGGVAGSLTDSLMGATVQAMYRYPSGKETEKRVGRDGTPNTFVRGWPWLNNDLVNLISSLAGAAVAIIIAALIGSLV
ncbi:MAG: DUF92 domain-containing protein [Chloroflexaceae bacterium]|nr:DUF92 domain-containing protein [Chloroflexaceae bacterium]